MKTGYKVINAVSNGTTAIEVINNPTSNYIINLGWMFLKTAYIAKTETTLGVWKLKRLKN